MKREEQGGAPHTRSAVELRLEAGTILYLCLVGGASQLSPLAARFSRLFLFYLAFLYCLPFSFLSRCSKSKGVGPTLIEIHLQCFLFQLSLGSRSLGVSKAISRTDTSHFLHQVEYLLGKFHIHMCAVNCRPVVSPRAYMQSRELKCTRIRLPVLCMQVDSHL